VRACAFVCLWDKQSDSDSDSGSRFSQGSAAQSQRLSDTVLAQLPPRIAAIVHGAATGRVLDADEAAAILTAKAEVGSDPLGSIGIVPHAPFRLPRMR
jgi:hypothetical protein